MCAFCQNLKQKFEPRSSPFGPPGSILFQFPFNPQFNTSNQSWGHFCWKLKIKQEKHDESESPNLTSLSGYKQHVRQICQEE